MMGRIRLIRSLTIAQDRVFDAIQERPYKCGVPFHRLPGITWSPEIWRDIGLLQHSQLLHLMRYFAPCGLVVRNLVLLDLLHGSAARAKWIVPILRLLSHRPVFFLRKGRRQIWRTWAEGEQAWRQVRPYLQEYGRRYGWISDLGPLIKSVDFWFAFEGNLSKLPHMPAGLNPWVGGVPVWRSPKAWWSALCIAAATVLLGRIKWKKKANRTNRRR